MIINSCDMIYILNIKLNEIRFAFEIVAIKIMI